MTEQYILALDQGTTSSRSILFDHQGAIVAKAQQDFEQLFPQSGWVEHDPSVIWDAQLSTIKEACRNAGVSAADIAAIGITNQRETTLIWDRQSGEPVYNAIVWQDRRTARYCDDLKKKGYEDLIKEKTGLVIDAYFSATKIKWLLDEVEGVREKAEKGALCFGTIDSWLVWKLSGGKTFITDVTNASRTMLFNIHTLEWDEELLQIFDIPRSMLPEVRQSSERYTETTTQFFDRPVPIAGIAGDQQAALFGQLCIEKGMLKNTYGTGCFLLLNTGDQPVFSQNNLVTTIAWTIKGKTTYALEGSIFVAGAAVQWVRDGLQMIEDTQAIEQLAASVPDNGGVYFVPALTGLGAPYWDSYARGAILGITRATGQGHIARATLEGVAFQVYDIVKAMEKDAGAHATELRVDGGASANNILMQIQADLFGFPVIRPKLLETTALGAAYLAGLAVGFWENVGELNQQWSVDQTFQPSLPREKVVDLVKNWHKAVSRSRNWID